MGIAYVLGEPGGFQISPGPQVSQVRDVGSQLLANFDSNLGMLVSSFGHFRAKGLELRTTIVYLWKNMDPKVFSGRTMLLGFIRQLKPHFSSTEVEDVIVELQELNVIGSTAD